MTLEDVNNQPHSIPVPAPSTEIIRVLHIDDDDNVQMFLKVFVEGDSNIKVTSIQSAEEAIQLVQTGAFDCLVSDYDMPGMDGITLAGKIREISNIPIIIYTGRGSEEIAEKAFAAGIDDYIRKEDAPAHYQLVSKRIRQAVERRRSNESYRNLFDNANDAIFLHTFDGVIIDINEVGCIRLGYSKGELIGKLLSKFAVPQNISFEMNLNHILRQRSAVFESSHITKDGRLVPVEVSTRVIKYNGVDAILSFSRDISDRKRLEVQMKERLEGLQSHALTLSKCEDVNAVASTTYQILHDVMDYKFFGLGVVDGNVTKFIPNGDVEDDWLPEYPLDSPGICSRAVKDGSTVVVPDVRLDPDYIGPKSGIKYLSEIVVPVKVGGRVVAVLNVEDEEQGRFTNNDRVLLEIFAEHVASSLNRIGLIEGIRRQEARIKTINGHAARLARMDTIRGVVNYSFEIIEELLGFEDGCVGEVEGDYLKFKYARNLSFQIPDLPLSGKGITARAARTGESQLVPDTQLDSDFVKDVDPADFLSELDVPIKIDGRVWGVINLENRGIGFFSEEDREVVEILAERVASAILRIRLLESASRYMENLEALHKHASDLSSLGSVGEVAEFSFKVVENILGFNLGTFTVVDEGHMRFVYANPASINLLPPMPIDGRGVVVRAVRTGKSQMIPDIRLDPDYENYAKVITALSELAVPVKIDGAVVAAFNFESERIGAFSEEDRHLIEVLAEHVGSALARIKQREVIEKSEERFRYILDSAPEGVTVNVFGKVVYANQHFADMMGYTIDELLQKGVFEITSENCRGLVEDRTRRRALGENVPSTYDVELIRKDGSFIPVEFSISRIVFNGEMASLTFIRDLSIKKEKQALQSKIASLHKFTHELNELKSADEVGKATLEILEDYLSCNFLSIQLAADGYLQILSTNGAEPIGLPMPIQGKGLTVRAAREKRTILVADTRMDPDFFQGSTESLSELAVPILCDGELIGVLNAESLELNAFGEEEKTLVETMADEVGSVLKRIKILEVERLYNHKLETLQLNAIKLSQARNIDEALDITCEMLRRNFGYNWVGIGSVDEKAIHYVRGIGLDLKGEDKIPLDRRSITARAVKSRVTQLVPDTSKDEDYIVLNPKDTSSNSELVVPIRVNDQVEFVLNLESLRLNAFSDQDQHLIELLSLHLGSAVELIRRREKLNSIHLHASRLESVNGIEDIAKLSLDTLREVLDYKISSFHFVKGSVLEMIANIGFEVEGRFTQALDGPGLIPYVVRECRSVYVPDVSRDEHYVRGPLVLGDDRSSEFVVPIMIDGVSIAAINLEDKRMNGFSDEDRELVELLAEHVTSAIIRTKHLEKIKTSNENYRNILNSSLDSVLLLSGTTLLYVNNKMAELLGYDNPSELIGKDITTTLTEEEKEKIKQRTLSRQRGEPQPDRYELRLIRKDGSIVEVEASVSLTEYEDKPAVLSIARDISDRKRYQEKLTKIHGSGKMLADATNRDEIFNITIDTVSQILEFDFAGLGIVEGNVVKFDREAGAELPKDWSIDLSKPSITARAVETGMPQLVKDTSLDPDYLIAPLFGKRRSALVIPLIVDGHPVATLNIEGNRPSMFTETDMSLIQMLIGQVSSALARLTHLENEINVRETHQREVMEAMERMSGMVRHDIRKPLQTIQSASYMLRHRPDRLEEFTQRIDESVEYAVKILEDLSALTKPETINKVPTNLNDIVEKAIECANIPAIVNVEKNLTPIILEIDQYRIRRVVDNLVKNAIEAMPDGGTLYVELKEVEGTAQLKVRDSGQGIPEEIGKKLFTPFYTTKHTGTGLGLAICKRIIEAHQGKIVFESIVGEGTSFIMTLPLSQVSSPQAINTQQSKSQKPQFRRD